MNTQTYTFQFNSRDSYLDYRAEWKSKYRLISSNIHELKKKLRYSNNETKSLTGDEMSTAQSELHYMAIEATEMLAELKQAKIEANRQWLAMHEHKQAA